MTAPSSPFPRTPDQGRSFVANSLTHWLPVSGANERVELAFYPKSDVAGVRQGGNRVSLRTDH